MAGRLTKKDKRNYDNKRAQKLYDNAPDMPRTLRAKKTNISLAAEKAALKGKVPDNMLNEIAQKNVNNKLKRAAAGES